MPLPSANSPSRRVRTTRRSVLIADKVADWGIAIGGMTVILAVTGIMVFLVQAVVPLFTGASPGKISTYVMPIGGERPLATALDEYKTVGVAIAGQTDIGAMLPGTPAKRLAGVTGSAEVAGCAAA